jgi:Rod binding domain-containing protein
MMKEVFVMSVSSISGVFTGSIFKGTTPQTKQKAAAAGFAQIFTTMLAKQMRQSMVGAENGPMGIGGGATGDIYGSFIDSAMGKALANSKSMNQLNRMITRELAGPRHPGNAASKASSSSANQFVRNAVLRAASSSLSPIYTGVTMTNDARGPQLLPPAPASSAPVLLTPPSEG